MVEDAAALSALRMLEERGSAPTVTMVTDTPRKRTCSLLQRAEQGPSCLKVLLGIPPSASRSYCAPPPAPSFTTHKCPVKSDFLSLFRSSLLLNFLSKF